MFAVQGVVEDFKCRHCVAQLAGKAAERPAFLRVTQANLAAEEGPHAHHEVSLL